MLGIIYLFLCFVTGYCLCKIGVPKLNEVTTKTFRGEAISLPGFFLRLPAWFLTGTLAMTWMTYLLGYCFRSQEKPLLYANVLGFSIAILFSGFSLFRFWKKRQAENKVSWKNNLPQTFGEWGFLIIILLLVSQLMFWTFYIRDKQLGVGLSVFSDFAPHLGMIRSFSYGNNFPTQYAHFAGEDIRYHFMFQFLAGNLEFLGLRLDFAFNLPSIFSLIGTFLLLYVLAVKLTGKRLAGYLAGFFFAFRSSPTLFTWFAKLCSQEGGFIPALHAMKENIEFIGETPNETWGLWNLNVYCNQRHLAFSLMALLLALLLFLPLLYEQAERIRKLRRVDTKLKKFLASLFTKEGWSIKEPRTAIFAGILLGATAFFNGAVLIATLSILFVTAIVSDRRLELLCVALLATGLSLLQSAFFVDGSVVSPAFYFGFLAEEKTWAGVLSYIFRLTGILPIVLLVCCLFLKGAERMVLGAFFVPFATSFFLSLTVDVTVNHKNIMLSLMLLGIFAAGGLAHLLLQKAWWKKASAVLLIFILTATGLYDYRTVLVRNAPKNNLTYRLDDELLCWIHENTTSQDVFLTANYYLNHIVLGGAMLYYGWPYYAWSAGYDTNYRENMVRQMYGSASKEELYELVVQENIRYIIVENANRVTEEYTLNEAVIDEAFEKVYESGSGEWMISIYDTKSKKESAER